MAYFYTLPRHKTSFNKNEPNTQQAKYLKKTFISRFI